MVTINSDGNENLVTTNVDSELKSPSIHTSLGPLGPSLKEVLGGEFQKSDNQHWTNRSSLRSPKRAERRKALGLRTAAAAPLSQKRRGLQRLKRHELKPGRLSKKLKKPPDKRYRYRNALLYLSLPITSATATLSPHSKTGPLFPILG